MTHEHTYTIVVIHSRTWTVPSFEWSAVCELLSVHSFVKLYHHHHRINSWQRNLWPLLRSLFMKSIHLKVCALRNSVRSKNGWKICGGTFRYPIENIQRKFVCLLSFVCSSFSISKFLLYVVKMGDHLTNEKNVKNPKFSIKSGFFSYIRLYTNNNIWMSAFSVMLRPPIVFFDQIRNSIRNTFIKSGK